MNDWYYIFVVLIFVAALTFSIVLAGKTETPAPVVLFQRTDTVGTGAFDDTLYSFSVQVTGADSFFGSIDWQNSWSGSVPTFTVYDTSATLQASGNSNTSNPALMPTYSLYVTAVNAGGATVASISLPVRCFMQDVLIETSDGVIFTQNLEVGHLLRQPDNSFRKIKAVQKTTIDERSNAVDRRVFSDESRRVRVTYWHKLKKEDGEMEIAGTAPFMHEFFPAFPFDVYHFELESKEDVILVHGSDLVLESLHD